MATRARKLVAPKPQKVTKASREFAKRDHSPKWDGADAWSGEEFNSYFRTAMAYYRFNDKDIKHNVINWMGRNGYSKKLIEAFKKTKDWRTSVTTGAIASCLLHGMPPTHPGFNHGRNSETWLRKEIEDITEAGKGDVEVVAAVKGAKTVEAPSIQDRIRQQASDMSEALDIAIDSWISDPKTFDPKAFSVVSLLRGKGAKAAQCRYVKSFYQKNYDLLLELASGNADEQLRESYSHIARKNVKKLIDFYESIMVACDQISAEAKVLKKPRAAKVKPAADLVKKIKFKLSDDKLGVASVPAAQLIGAQGAIVYNTKNRKMGYYIATSSAGMTVKGSSIINFTQKSIQKTLRKPLEQIKEFKELNTQKRFETWFTKNVRTTEILLNGRMSADIMILKVYK